MEPNETVKDRAIRLLEGEAAEIQKRDSRLNATDALGLACKNRPDLYQQYRDPRSKYRTVEDADRDVEKRAGLSELNASSWEDVVIDLSKRFVPDDFCKGLEAVRKRCPDVWKQYLEERREKAKCF